MNQDASGLLTANEVASAFRVSRSTVARWARDGDVPAIRVGGVVRFRKEDVERLLQPNEQAAS